MTCVLVVDGDSSARNAIRTVLELEGFEVVVADGDGSGLKAIFNLLGSLIVGLLAVRFGMLVAQRW
jgi:DNA-binding response OmpR family regulator